MGEGGRTLGGKKSRTLPVALMKRPPPHTLSEDYPGGNENHRKAGEGGPLRSTASSPEKLLSKALLSAAGAVFTPFLVHPGTARCRAAPCGPLPASARLSHCQSTEGRGAREGGRRP